AAQNTRRNRVEVERQTHQMPRHANHLRPPSIMQSTKLKLKLSLHRQRRSCMPVPEHLREAAEEIGPGIVADRRDIHQNPELGYAEQRTAALVAARLQQLGLEVRTGVGGTGVVGLLRGGQSGKTVLLRADMDALAIHEES